MNLEVVRLRVDGEPPTKGRPRFANGHTYTPQTTKQAEDAFGWAIKNSHPGIEPDGNGLFRLEAHFSQSSYQRRDLDNMVKLISDACNGLVWADDSQVVEIEARLERGRPEAYTEIVIVRVADYDESIPTRACARCGTVFRMYKSWKARKYCSDICSAQAQLRRVAVTCAHCGIVFESHRAYADKALFCSVACRTAYGRTEATCAVCQRVFSVPVSWRRKRRTCSKECAALLSHVIRKATAGACRDCGAALSKKTYTRCRRCATLHLWSAKSDARMPVVATG